MRGKKKVVYKFEYFNASEREKGYWGAKLLGDRVCDMLEREREREIESIGRQGHVSWLRERESGLRYRYEWVSEWVNEWVNGSDDQKTKACVAVFVKGHQPHNAIMHYMLLLLFVASCCCCCSIYYTIY